MRKSIECMRSKHSSYVHCNAGSIGGNAFASLGGGSFKIREIWHKMCHKKTKLTSTTSQEDILGNIVAPSAAASSDLEPGMAKLPLSASAIVIVVLWYLRART